MENHHLEKFQAHFQWIEANADKWDDALSKEASVRVDEIHKALNGQHPVSKRLHEYIEWLGKRRKFETPTDKILMRYFKGVQKCVHLDLAFGKQLSLAGRSVICHLGELPELKKGKEWETLREIHKRIGHPHAPACNSMYYMGSIPVIGLVLTPKKAIERFVRNGWPFSVDLCE